MSSHNIRSYNKDFCLCSKYIVPILSSELEAREFWRFFLTKCAEAGVSSAMLPQVVSAAYNPNLGLNVDTDYLLKYDGEVVDLPQLIDLIQYERSKKPDEFPDCRSYCASKLYGTDKASKAVLCRLCENFNKWDYRNKLLEEDYQLLKFICENVDNLQTFKEQVSCLSNQNFSQHPFTSLIELTREYLCYTDTPPVVVSLFNTLYTVICVSESDFFASMESLDVKLRDGKFFLSVSKTLCGSNAIFKTFSEKNPDIWRTCYDIFVDKIVSAPDISSEDQFQSIIKDHIELYWGARKKRAKKVAKDLASMSDRPQITLFDVLENYDPDDESRDLDYKLEEPDNVREILDVAADQDAVNIIDADTSSSHIELENDVVSDQPIQEGGDTPDAHEDSEDSVPADTSALNSDTGIVDEEVAPDVDDDGSLVFDSSVEQVRKNINRRPEGASDAGKYGDDIYVPHYPAYIKEDIQNVFLSVYAKPNIYYSERLAKRKDGRFVVSVLSIECLYVENEGWILVFVSSNDETAWYCPITDIPSGLKKMIKSEKVVKVCYTPYILYSSLRNVGLYARMCYGLYNMNRYIGINKDVTDDISSMEKIYLGISRNDLPVDTLGMTMLTYEHICNYERMYCVQQSYVSEGKKLNVRSQLLRDEILGYSYMRETYLYDESVLFISGQKGLLFNNNYVHSPRQTGYFVTYYLRTEYMDNMQRQRLYLYILTEMLEKGIMNKYPFFIVTFSNGVMTLFVEEKSFSFITNMIHERMDMFAVDNELRDYIFEMVEEFIDVDLKLSDEERYARAVRHNDRMNELRRIKKASDFIDKNTLELSDPLVISDTHIHVQTGEPSREIDADDKAGRITQGTI